jgi:hypothetical protein
MFVALLMIFVMLLFPLLSVIWLWIFVRSLAREYYFFSILALGLSVFSFCLIADFWFPALSQFRKNSFVHPYLFCNFVLIVYILNNTQKKEKKFF